MYILLQSSLPLPLIIRHNLTGTKSSILLSRILTESANNKGSIVRRHESQRLKASKGEEKTTAE